MTFPTPYVVGWHVRDTDGPDRFREAPTYTPAKSSPGTPVRVIQWAAAKSDSSGRDGTQMAGHVRTELTVKLYVPPEFNPAPGDLIDLPAGPAGQYEVVGYPEDCNHGFHGWRPGNVINLRRIEG
ncbi:hypothetical protein [Nocardia sp. NPDC049149]|uniref:hypothetical protein n=1 Tax=Nocardia sp. NPDC049149 TaxID=3364315 RepID=UPI00371F18DC